MLRSTKKNSANMPRESADVPSKGFDAEVQIDTTEERMPILNAEVPVNNAAVLEPIDDADVHQDNMIVPQL